MVAVLPPDAADIPVIQPQLSHCVVLPGLSSTSSSERDASSISSSSCSSQAKRQLGEESSEQAWPANPCGIDEMLQKMQRQRDRHLDRRHILDMSTPCASDLLAPPSSWRPLPEQHPPEGLQGAEREAWAVVAPAPQERFTISDPVSLFPSSSPFPNPFSDPTASSSSTSAFAAPMPGATAAAASARSGDSTNLRSQRELLLRDLQEEGLELTFDPKSSRYNSRGGISNAALAAMKEYILKPAAKDGGMVECRMIRERSRSNWLQPRYILETEEGTFLMSAKKETNNHSAQYVLSLSEGEDSAKNSDMLLGTIRSNFLGLEFVAYDTGLSPQRLSCSMPEVHALQLVRHEIAAVQYRSKLWGSKPRGPRKMEVAIPKILANGEVTVCRTLRPESEGLMAQLKNESPSVSVFRNKQPKWNELIGAFVLNFNKRVTQASVKNFQLTSDEDIDTVTLQFGRIEKDAFNMDFRHPFSPLQAFIICLSAFDNKLCCE